MPRSCKPRRWSSLRQSRKKTNNYFGHPTLSMLSSNFTNSLHLSYPKPNAKLRLCTDKYSTAIGAVL